MRSSKSLTARAFKLLPLLLLAAAIALTAASCGGGAGSSQTSDTTTKLPPGATTTESSLTTTSDSTGTTQTQAASDDKEEENDSTGTGSNETSATELTKTVYLSGANLSVVSVTREDSNGTVAGSSVREVAGDFLLIEMAVENAGGELVDLSDFSFRLWNPAIDADLYEDFYGTDGTYGGYVSENMISATLLDYETLQSVSMKLRVGETVDNVFLFFDLNPQSTAANAGVTLAGTNLVIYDTETGGQVEINLAGYAT